VRPPVYRKCEPFVRISSSAKQYKYSISAKTCGGRNWKNQMGHQKLRGPIQSERQFAIFGRNERAPSEPNASAASQIIYLRLAPNHRALATMLPRRDAKIMTSKRRKLPNRRSCFLFRIEGYGSCRNVRQPSVSHDAIQRRARRPSGSSH
jgi:hypothetical protein